jgi:hypothetical protein
MLTVVVVCNVLLSLVCLYVAWQLWKIRRSLTIAADAVTVAERATYEVLHGAPRAIAFGQSGIRGWRGSYERLELQRQQVQQILTLLGLVQTLLRQTTRYWPGVRPQTRTDALKSQLRLRRLQRQQRFTQ